MLFQRDELYSLNKRHIFINLPTCQFTNLPIPTFVFMYIDELREYCIAKPFTEETFPFDEDTLVFKVKGKMFALISLSEPDTVNLKCDPEYAAELRERYEGVRPGYHMNKKMWNTVSLDTDVDETLLRKLIDHSYAEVVKGLPKKVQKEMEGL